MGQKAIPTGLRLGIIHDWTAKWYSGTKSYADNLNSDLELRRFIKKKLINAAVSKVVIQRPAQSVNVTIHTARPGIVIGKKGEDISGILAQYEPGGDGAVALGVHDGPGPGRLGGMDPQPDAILGAVLAPGRLSALGSQARRFDDDPVVVERPAPAGETRREQQQQRPSPRHGAPPRVSARSRSRA
ncbi:MAG: KH domain-containing protein, partial [Proteobacteria bacterium]|nr:KH domain-containing protein [Pseudomonadota bacterium]